MITKKYLSLFLGLWLFACPALQAKELAAIITRIVGSLYVRGPSDTGYRPAKKGQFIYEGTTVKTGQGDRAAMSFVNGTEVKINQSTTYAIKPTHPTRRGQGSDTQLRSGRVWFKVIRKGSKFQIRTALAAAAVRGTEGDVSVGNFFSASCLEGAFQVTPVAPGEAEETPETPADGAGVLVSAGQVCVVQEGKGPEVMPIKTKDNWYDLLSDEAKGGFKFAPAKTDIDLNTAVKITVQVSNKDGQADPAFVGTIRPFADNKDVVFSDDGRTGWGSDIGVDLVSGEGSFWVKSASPGYFNVSGQRDGYEVMPARLLVSKPGERTLDVDIETDKGDRKKIHLKFKR